MSHPLLSDLLMADGPLPEHARALDLYGRFVGSWDMEGTWFEAGRPVRTARGEWHFGWILGGRAIQDVLFKTGAQPYEYGTTLRCYDARTDMWHIVWTQPCSG